MKLKIATNGASVDRIRQKLTGIVLSLPITSVEYFIKTRRVVLKLTDVH